MQLLRNQFMQVTVRVLDTNDNGPIFQYELYVFNIFENSTQTNVIGSVMAEDHDKGTVLIYVLTVIIMQLSLHQGQMQKFHTLSQVSVHQDKWDLLSIHLPVSSQKLLILIGKQLTSIYLPFRYGYYWRLKDRPPNCQIQFPTNFSGYSVLYFIHRPLMVQGQTILVQQSM